MLIYLLSVQTILHLTVGKYPLICPGKSHWNFRASKFCPKIDDYRCLWDVNNDTFVEQCEGYYAQIKGYRKVIEGDINAGDCSPNTYQPREWTTEKNFDCEFEKSLCNELGQIVYDDGDSLSDRSCRCDYTAGYVFLQKPKHLCYCVPSEEDCTCVPKRCPPDHELDPEYECRARNKWQISFRCPQLPYGGSSTVSPYEHITRITEVSDKPPSNKHIVCITLLASIVIFIGIGVVLLYKDSAFTKKLSEITVYEGEMAIFSCELDDERMEVIWFVNDKEISLANKSYQAISNGHSRELEINDVTKSDDGKKITARAGYEKTSATLVVKDSLIKRRLRSVIVYEGETAIFSCEVKDEEIEVIWSVNGETISTGDSYEMKSDGCVRELLIFNAPKSKNGMKITATVQNEISTTTLMVKDSVFSKKLSDTAVNGGETAILSCEIIDRKIKVIWLVNDEEVSPENKQYQINSNGRSRELVINDVKTSDGRMKITAKVGYEKTSATLLVEERVTGSITLEQTQCEHKVASIPIQALTESTIDELKEELQRMENENQGRKDDYQMNKSSRIRCSKCFFVVKKIFPRVLSKILDSSGNSAKDMYDKIQLDEYLKSKKLTSKENSTIQTLLTDEYNELDFPLMVKIIAFFKIIPTPSLGWDSEPGNTDTKIGHDVQRLIKIRNNIMTKKDADVSETEFENFFSEITVICNRIDSYLKNENINSFTKQVEDAKLRPCDCSEVLSFMFDYEHLKELFTLEIGKYIIKVYEDKKMTDQKVQIPNESADRTHEKKRRIRLTFDLKLHPDEINRLKELCREQINGMLKTMTVLNITNGSVIMDILISEAVLINDELLQLELQKLLDTLLNYGMFEQDILAKPCITVVLSESEALQLSEDGFNHIYNEEDTTGLLHIDLEVNTDVVQSEESLQVELTNFFNRIVSVSNGGQLFPVDRPIVSIVHSTATELPWKRKLNDVTVYEDESARLSCEVTDENLEVVWFVNDVPINSDDSYEMRSEGCVRHLLIPEATLGATDMEITAKVDDQMTTAKVVVKALPWKQKLNDVTVYEGDSARLSCEVTDENLEVVWFVNDVPINSDDSYEMSSEGCVRHLLILEATLDDTDLEITAKVDDQMTTAKVVVKALPWNKKLNDVTVYEGDSARLSCEVTDENLEVVWFVNDVPINSDDSYEMRSEGCVRHLLIPEATLGDTDMEITAKVDDQMTTAKVVVKELPWKRKLNDVTVYEGESARLSCEVTDENVEVVWFVNDVPINFDDPYEVRSEGCVRHLLVTGATNMEITAKVGDQITTAKVVVKVLPWKRKLSDVTVYEGESGRLSCEVINEDLEVVWFVNDVPVSSDDSFEVRSEGCVRHLLIAEAKLSTDMKITAKVGDQMATAKVVVKALPWKRKLNDVTVYEGESATFSCEVTDEDLEVVWFVNNVPISSNDQYGVRSEGCVRHLLIPETKLSDTDMEIIAKVGNQMSTANIMVKALPWKRKLNDVTVNEGESARLSCEVTDENLEVVWFVNDVPTNSDDPYEVRSEGCFRHLLIPEATLGNTDMEITAKVDDQMTTAKVVVKGSNMFDGTQERPLLTHNEIRDTHTSNKLTVDTPKQAQMVKELTLDERKQAQVFLKTKHLLGKKINNHIPVHIQEQFKKIVDNWIFDDKMFVPTEAAEKVMTKIKEHNFVVVTGHSGTGKTYTVRHTALVMEAMGFIVVPAVIPDDISKYYKHGCKTVFVFDDLCGRFTLNQNYLDQWQLHKQSLDTLFNDKCCKIIASCRLQVFRDTKMTDIILDMKIKECGLGSLGLSIDERKKMVQKYFDSTEVPIADEQLCEYDFLPFLCSVLRNEKISDVKECFQNPFSFFKDKFQNLYKESNEGKLKYCALFICILYNNKLTQKHVKENNEVFKSLLRNVLEECELASTIPWSSMEKALQSLKDEYIVITDGTYKLKHDKLFDFLAKYFGEEHVDFFITFAAPDFIAERFCIQSMNTSENIDDYIRLTDDKIQALIKRLIKDWNKGEVNNVFRNTNMKSLGFRKTLFSYFKDLNPSLQKELVQKQDKIFGDTPLSQMCMYGHLEFIKWILGQDNLGSNFNTIKQNGWTPLMTACYYNNPEVVKVLLTCKQMDVNHSADDGSTALYLACQKGNIETITELLQVNVEINKTTKQGWTPLMTACYNNHTKVVNELLKCEQLDANHSNDNGWTALHLACQEGNVKIVIELIHCNIDLNKRNKDGWNPLMLACYNNHPEVVKVLLNCEQIDFNHSADDGSTALHLGCRKGNKEIVYDLLKVNVDINKIEKNGWTPFMTACYYNNPEVVKVLLTCKQIDVYHSADDGSTALYLACQKGNIEIITELLQVNVEINKTTKQGWTPLMTACYNNHTKVVNELLKCEQLDANHSNDNGWTALHLACQEGNVKIVIELIHCNIDLNKSKKDGWNPLMLACYNNHPDVVKVLLNCEQIDVNHSADDGSTALQLACLKGNVEIVTELILCNADVNRRNGNGWTPLIFACNKTHLEVVKVLLKCKELDAEQSDNDGCTPLYHACYSGNIQVVNLLIANNVDVNRGVEENRPKAFMICRKHYTDEFKKYLYRQNTELNQTEQFKQLSEIRFCHTVHTNVVRELAKCPRYVITCKDDVCFPLEMACYENHTDVVKELLNCPNVEINRCTSYKQTALYWACIQGHVESMALLLEHKADVNISDINGISPLHIACWASNKEAISMLIEHGADKTLQNLDGKTPVDIVIEENDQGCLSILN